jgi:AcrR family transcriptional regulator
MSMSSGSPPVNKSGQAMRRKGHEKRQRLVEATGKLLRTCPLAQLRAADIAREADTSLPNFYLYFDGVIDAVLATVQQVLMGDDHIVGLLDAVWPTSEIDARALEFVSAYLLYWREHAPLLRVRSMLVAEGEPRFAKAEEEASLPLLKALSAKLARARPDIDHAPSAAGVILAMLDRLAAYVPADGSNAFGVTSERLIDAAARVLADTVRGCPR